ncbi:mitochondrial import inner membrane translocase subunit Tim29 [Hemicordylus capensis]|uniref:mitochondrial import inner membrane translocase subunit Tim29 n=1 Tax=Hemicordylus capensis TaxID=884348 RepID=UPI0023032553|nr:mitochondrial import inner membrane translocase subunit Tim29 [Hemicordylus capensis]
MAEPSSLGRAQEKRRLWERLRTGRLASWWKSLLHDYAEACKEVALGVRQRPGKASLYLSLLAAAVGCSLHSPCEASFEASLLEASGTLLLLSPWIRSNSSEEHVQRLMKLKNRGQLRFQSLLFFSLMYEVPFDASADLYQVHCKYLKPRWTEFPKCVLDVGFWGRWWVLHSKMQNSDINDEEFQYLPAHLRVVSFHNLHSETNEKLFNEKYKPVVLTEEQIQQAERENPRQLHT